MAAVRDRYPDSPVDTRAGDLLDLADDLRGAFDLVVEMEAVAGDGVELESLDEVLPPGRVNPLWRQLLVRDTRPRSRTAAAGAPAA